MFVPNIKSENYGESGLFTRLLKDRIIFVSGEINDETSSVVIAELLHLEAEDPKADICMYINAPGGSVSDGLAIYDTMQFVKCDVSTVCVGMAASMGAFLLAGGCKGKRYILPNAEVMIHQPLGGSRGQATDMEIAAKHIIRTKKKLNEILAMNTGKDIKKINADSDRDNWLTAEEAVSYGLVDKIMS